MNTKLTSLLLSAFASITFFADGQSRGDIFVDDYSTNQVWTQVNSGITIQNGQVVGKNAEADLSQNRVFKQIVVPIKNIDNWSIETEFTDLAGPSDYPSYDLIALTPDNKDVRLICSSVTEGCSATTNDNKSIYVNTGKIAGTNDMILYAGITNDKSSEAFYINSSVLYYITFQKLGTDYVFSVFSDAARQNHLPGSPKTFVSQTSLPDYTFVQHAVATTGGNFRSSSFTLDNTWISSVPKVVTGLNADKNTNGHKLEMSPNPASSTFKVKVGDFEIQNITILNYLGQSIINIDNTSEANIGSFPKGTYVVKAKCNNTVYTEKLVVD